MITSISPHLAINTNINNPKRAGLLKTGSDSFIRTNKPKNNLSFGSVNLDGYEIIGKLSATDITNKDNIIFADVYSKSVGSSTLFYVMKDEKPLGQMHIQWINSKSEGKYLEICYINTRAHQEIYKGFGRGLIELAKSISKKDPVAQGRIELYAYKEAIGFYKKMGFKFMHKYLDVILNTSDREMYYQPQKIDHLSNLKNQQKLKSKIIQIGCKFLHH
jgi:ribosomal protein S18 acetylase RimI-like enzyme